MNRANRLRLRTLQVAVALVVAASSACREGGPKASAGTGNEGSPSRPLWGTCAQVENAVAAARRSDPALMMDVVYEPLAKESPPASAVTVPCGGIERLIPAREYKCVLGSDRARSRFDLSLLLKSGDGGLTIGPMIGDDPFPDVFQLSGNRLDPPAQDRVRFTTELFGKAPTLFDILDLGFRARASGFVCRPSELAAATRDAVVLILKSVFLSSGREAHAYRDAGLPGALMVRKVDAKGRYSVDYLVPAASGQIAVQATTRDSLFQSELVALLSAGVAGTLPGLTVRPLDPPCDSMARFAAAPTPGAARDLRALLAGDPAQSKAVAILDEYVGARGP